MPCAKNVTSGWSVIINFAASKNSKDLASVPDFASGWGFIGAPCMRMLNFEN